MDSQDLRNLWILDLHHPLFLGRKNMTGSRPDSSDLSEQMLWAEVLRNQSTVSDRLRLAINVLDLAPTSDLYVASHQFVL